MCPDSIWCPESRWCGLISGCIFNSDGVLISSGVLIPGGVLRERPDILQLTSVLCPPLCRGFGRTGGGDFSHFGKSGEIFSYSCFVRGGATGDGFSSIELESVDTGRELFREGEVLLRGAGTGTLLLVQFSYGRVDSSSSLV